jgi:hypothetical protein
MCTGSVAGAPAIATRSSLYCFALMQPATYEESLILWQANEGTSIFACDEAAVYSNVSRELMPGLTTIKVNTTLACDKGTQFGNAMNTRVFLAVWATLFANGRYKNYDWVVKIDPDSVFFPRRLYDVLNPLVDIGRQHTGIYINNCAYGMHGPLEVLSVAAVDTLGAGWPQCVEQWPTLGNASGQWGEDLFVDQCMQQVLHVPRFDALDIVWDGYCLPPQDWNECNSWKVAAFHPFKEVSMYETCYRRALRASELGRSSLYCFALMQPATHEESLILWQANEGASIFACDEAAVYSNVSRELMPGLMTTKIDTTQKRGKAGEFVENARIFFDVWDAVVANGRYKKHDWTVKVDPDCVFFPHRIHDELNSRLEDGRRDAGVYISSGKPLEVLSVAAVDAWGEGWQTCANVFIGMCDREHKLDSHVENSLCERGARWELTFLNQCLQNVLYSRRVDRFDLLLDERTTTGETRSPLRNGFECNNERAAAFHPYKSVSKYEACYLTALTADDNDAVELVIGVH